MLGDKGPQAAGQAVAFGQIHALAHMADQHGRAGVRVEVLVHVGATVIVQLWPPAQRDIVLLGAWQIPFTLAVGREATAEIWSEGGFISVRLATILTKALFVHIARYPFEVFAYLAPWSVLLLALASGIAAVPSEAATTTPAPRASYTPAPGWDAGRLSDPLLLAAMCPAE